MITYNIAGNYSYELACKSVSTTFKWNVAGTPITSFVNVYLTFIDYPARAPMEFTTEANGQLTIDGLIMGNYSLEGIAFTEIQSTHLQTISQILLEPTIGKGCVKKFGSFYYYSIPIESQVSWIFVFFALTFFLTFYLRLLFFFLLSLIILLQIHPL